MFFNHGLNSYIFCKLLCTEEAWCLLELAWVSLRGSTTKAEEAIKATSLFRHCQSKVPAALSDSRVTTSKAMSYCSYCKNRIVIWGKRLTRHFSIY